MRYLINLAVTMTLIDLSGFGFTDDIAKKVISRAVTVCREAYQGRVSTITRKTELDFDVKCKRGEE